MACLQRIYIGEHTDVPSLELLMLAEKKKSLQSLWENTEAACDSYRVRFTQQVTIAGNS